MGLGQLATVWDEEVAGLRKALEKSPSDWKILLLTDSQAIAAIREAGKRGKHRTADLGSMVLEVRKRQEALAKAQLGWAG